MKNSPGNATECDTSGTYDAESNVIESTACGNIFKKNLNNNIVMFVLFKDIKSSNHQSTHLCMLFMYVIHIYLIIFLLNCTENNIFH